MRNKKTAQRLRHCVCLFVAITGSCSHPDMMATRAAPREVLFWHFWGGDDRAVVEEIVQRFNESQTEHRVRAIAMPGNNLDLKFFLSTAGGDPPDLLNQDDPIVADWASRGVLQPLRELATAAEYDEMQQTLLPAAKALATYDGEFYALANGLDIRALYVNTTLLAEHGLAPPQTLEELDRIATTIAPPGEALTRVGFLPDPRRLWAWGVVFGGEFYNRERHALTADDPHIVRALEWMGSYAEKYGASRLAEFRTGDQSLPGAPFPLLADRRYAAIMDGQWRVRDLRAYRNTQLAAGERLDEFSVVPLPPPTGGKENAGWVNGNFFVVPKQAKNAAGAWEFMKFWSGLAGNQAEAARACAAGGWIPVTQKVIDEPAYQALLDREPMMRTFVELAGSEHQQPTPAIRLGAAYQRAVVAAAEEVLYRGADPQAQLEQVVQQIGGRLQESKPAPPLQ